MRSMTHLSSRRPWLSAVPAAFLLAGALIGPALADDRDLLRLAQDKPYVFVILDTSGSMNWQPGGDAYAPANGDDPASKMYQSKSALYRVLTDPELDGTRWGFATYNQDSSTALRKHWLYTARTQPSAAWLAALNHPVIGRPQLFGDSCGDDADGDDTCNFDDNTLSSCTTTTPIDLSSTAGAKDIFNWPVLGDTGAAISKQWMLNGGMRWELTWQIASGTLGNDTITVSVTARENRRTSGGNCSSTDSFGNPLRVFGPTTLTYDRSITTDSQGRTLLGASGVLSYQNTNSNPADPWDFHDTGSSNTCGTGTGAARSGVEKNTDTGNDDNSSTYNLKTLTVRDPLLRNAAAFDRGDFVPLDWKDDVSTMVSGTPTGWTLAPVPLSHRLSNRDFILRKLAPNFSPSMTVDPDFRAAPFFQDHPVDITPNDNTEGIKPLAAYAAVPPLYPDGSTPLGNSLQGFLTWYDLWQPFARGVNGDPKYSCRSTNIIFVTDGDESCYGGALDATTQTDGGGDWNPCYVAKQLYTRGVRTFVVGFGLAANSTNALTCMAREGGTSAADFYADGEIDGPGVIYPSNEDALVDAIKEGISNIRSGTATFASAAVPSVTTDASDKVILTEFTPIESRPANPAATPPITADPHSVWPSKIFSFVKPVPLNNGLPDLTAVCTSETDTACFAWEAQKAIVDLQVKPSVADPIGNASNQRRVYYNESPRTAVPQLRHFFERTAGTEPLAQRRDLWDGMRISYSTPSTDATAETAANFLIGRMHTMRAATPSGGSFTEFVIGDNFHSDPLALGSPNNTTYFQQDVGADLALACTAGDDDDRRYQRFAFKQERRRRMVLLGTNEGALHAIDTGIFKTGATPQDPGRFTNGTGKELFGFVPRTVLPQIKTIFDPAADRPEYTVDGKPVATDVLIDPVHSGFGSGTPPAACDRIWRTVLLGGLREGGGPASLAERPQGVTTDPGYRVGSYYALDITNPDPVVDMRATNPDPNHIPFFVPQISGANETVPTCAGNGDGSSLPAGCGPTAFASTLWEFTDSVDGIRLDEDNNGHIDLAQSWSAPNVGRLRVCVQNCTDSDLTNDAIESRFVTVFGGGIDGENVNVRGAWIYIVDIETGDAIYKQRVRGSVPSEPATIDTDFDGYLDRIYVGDVYGLVYRVDLEQPVSTGGVKYLPLTSVTISEVDRLGVTHSRTMQRAIDSNFAPRVFFNATGNLATDTTLSATTSLTARPIYYPPSVFFVPPLEKYALAFGTGNRLQLVATGQPAGRFFTVTDDFDWATLPLATNDTGRPLNRASLINIDFSAPPNATANYLTDPLRINRRGWHTEVNDDERLVVEPLTVSGVVLFSMFTPRPGFDPLRPVCSNSGVSRVFGVFATNAAGVLSSGFGTGTPAPGGTAVPFRTIDDLTTSFFVEQMQTGNPPEPGQQFGALTDVERDTMENIKKFLPRNASFPPGYGSRINVRTSRGGYESIVPIPLAVIESNFRED